MCLLAAPLQARGPDSEQGAVVRQAPEALLEAPVPEEPTWDRARLLEELRRQIRAEERLRAEGRAQVEAEGRSALLEARVVELQDNLRAAQQQADDLRRDLDRERTERRRLEEALALRSDQIQDLRRDASAEESDEELRRLRDRLQERDAGLAKLRREHEDLQTELAEARRAGREAEQARRASEGELREARESLETVRRQLATALEQPRRPAEAARLDCEARVEAAYRRGQREAEKTWQERARGAEDARMHVQALEQSLRGLEEENRRLRGALRDARAAEGASELEEAYQRGLRDGAVQAAAETAAEPTPGERAARARAEELGEELSATRRELASAMARLQEREAELQQTRRRSEPGPATVDCTEAVARAREAESRRWQEEWQRREAEVNRQAAARLDAFFAELKDQEEEGIARARKEEARQADRAFRRVLHEISSRQERQAARRVWEEER